ncbi:MAG: paraquat-inducible protein A [Bdellovibrionia bacterium]
MKYLVKILMLLCFGVVVALSPIVVRDANQLQQYKSDLGELNHIYYGIFSVNAWKGQIKRILFAEINRIDMNSTVKDLKGTLENQLTVIIDKLNERIREANGDSFGGKIKQALIDLVVDVDEVKKGVPTYADALIVEVTKPETERKVKKIATKKLQAYFSATYQKQNTSKRDAALESSGAADVETAKTVLADLIATKSRRVFIASAVIIAFSTLLLLIVGFFAKSSRFGFVLVIMILFVLMGIGVSVPMIDLEAKIAEMSFILLGHNVVFENQVLYFQSKSVLDVFSIMINHEDFLMQFVGVLMISFSVILPTLKLISMLGFYFDLKNVRQSRLARFFVFHSGKWSMADVMVIAIFMAYIGFNGIVTSQFKKITALVPSEVVFIATNGTSLQPGFYIFLAYVLLALAASSVFMASFERN